MKTPEEIKKGLEHCKGANPCADCTYDRRDFPQCIIRLQSDALSLIQQLEAKDAKQYQRIAELETELAAAKRERDAAVRWLSGNCNVCRWAGTEKCDSCDEHEDAWFDDGNSNWEWEGICPDTEVHGDG